jgi:hypothetical protein
LAYLRSGPATSSPRSDDSQHAYSGSRSGKVGCKLLRTASLLELITINQQRLVRSPEIIDAILANPLAVAKPNDELWKRAKSFLRKSEAPGK